MRRLLLVLGFFLAAHAAAGQSTPPIRCGGVTITLPPNLPPVTNQSLKALADSIPCIRASQNASVRLRARLTRRADSLSRGQAVPPLPEPEPSPEPEPEPTPADTSAVKIDLFPSSGPSLLVDSTQQFTSLVSDSAGAVRAWAVTWSSSAPGVATVNSAGLATAVSEGSAYIRGAVTAASSVKDSVRLTVTAPPPEDTISDVPPVTPTLILQDTTINGDLTIGPDENVLLRGTVTVNGNVLVPAGALSCRPWPGGTRLVVGGGDPASYVGGGIEYSAALSADRGIWVWNTGRLDWAGTPKKSWNRTGTDPTWSPSDEYWIAPTTVGRGQGDYPARTWEPGDSIPQVDPRVPAAEVANVTRDCKIEASPAAHIHVHSVSVQRFQYVELIGMGVARPNGDMTFGRYALHFHLMGNASQGLIVRGVSCVACKGNVFVPHTSHGIAWIDNVAVNSRGSVAWWDHGDVTYDVLFDQVAAIGVYNELVGSGASAFLLGAGRNMTVRNSVAAGVNGSSGPAVGFDWPEPAGYPDSILSLTTWTFEDNVAHNNRVGLRFWDNLQATHIQSRTTTYRNSGGGVENGAYISANRYFDQLSIQDGFQFSNDESQPRAAMVWNASSVTGTVPNEGARVIRCTLEALEGPALEIGHRQLAGDPTLRRNARFENCNFIGTPKVRVGNGENPWFAEFIRTNVLPEDITFDNFVGNYGSIVLIDHADGRKWTVTFNNGLKTVAVR